MRHVIKNANTLFEGKMYKSLIIAGADPGFQVRGDAL
jgi:hypothetical protein